MNIELILSIAALAGAGYAFILAREANKTIDNFVPPPPPPVDAYTRKEVEAQIEGVTEQINQLRTRLYELRDQCNKGTI